MSKEIRRMLTLNDLDKRIYSTPSDNEKAALKLLESDLGRTYAHGYWKKRKLM